MENVDPYSGRLIGLEFVADAYGRLYEAIVKGSPLADRIPDFVFKESISLFEKSEQYEKCSVIKRFLDANRHRVFEMDRNDWMDYGWTTRRRM